MLDLEPATRRVADLVAGVPDDRLTERTPCPDYTLGDLLAHIDGLSLAFTIAARKPTAADPDIAPSGDAGDLGDDWRTRIPKRLSELAEAWRDPAAWEGMTRAGGLDLPGDAAGRVALNEVVVHGWDLAKAIGRPYDTDPASAEACLAFVTEAAKEPAEGLFGPPVDPGQDPTEIDRIVALAGRDPAWPASRAC